MRSLIFIAGIALVELHGPSGQPITVNPAKVSTLRPPIDAPGHWGAGARCIIVMSNGKSNAVAEDCATAAKKLQAQ